MTKKKIILIVAALLIVGVSIGGYLKREEIAVQVTNWRAAGLLVKSIKASDGEDWKTSEQLLRAAWQLHPGDFEILRQWFTVAKQGGSRELLGLAHAVFKHEDATGEDRREVLALFFAIGDRVTLAKLHSELPEEEKKHPQILDLGARFALGTGQPGLALNLIRELQKVRKEPGDLLLLASALAQTPSEENENQIAAQEIIDQLFQPGEDHQLALAAFSVLGQIPTDLWQLDTFANATERLEKIAETTEVPPGFLLLDTRRRLLADPENRDQIVEEAVGRFIETEPAILGQWLLGQGFPDRVLVEIATPEQAQQSPEFFALRVQAFLLKKDWAAAEELLADPHPDTDEATILSYRGALAALEGDEAGAKNFWEQALSGAMNAHGRDALLNIARLAGAGNEDIRNRAVTEALKRPSAIPIPVSDVPFIFAHLVESDSFEDLYKVSLNLFRSEPENPVVLNNVAWLGLIHGSANGPVLIPKLEGMLEKFPELAGLRSTLILAYLDQGKLEEASAAAPPLIEAENKGAGSLAVLALLSATQKNEADALAYVKEINLKELMSWERLYFKRVLEKEGIRGVIPATLPW